MNNNISGLQHALRRLTGCAPTYVETVAVVECFNGFGKSVTRQHEVAIFKIDGHPKAERAYAWSQDFEDQQPTYVVVFGVPPIDTPQAAVSAAMAAEISKGALREN